MQPGEILADALFGIEEAIKLEPGFAAFISAAFSKGIPTEQEWNDLHQSVADGSYKQFVPTTVLPDAETANDAPPAPAAPERQPQVSQTAPPAPESPLGEPGTMVRFPGHG